MRSISIFVYLMVLGGSSYAQKTDYKDIRHSNYLSTCGSDSQATFKARLMLLRVDTHTISKNLDMYYHDLGLIYYKMSLHSRNTHYMDTAVILYKKALRINPENKDALWDCAIALVFSKPRHCDEGMKYIDAYLKLVPLQEADTEAITGLRKICKEERHK